MLLIGKCSNQFKMFFLCHFLSCNFYSMQLSQDFGPVFSLRRGSERMVFISGYKMVKEALVTQLDSFVERPIVPLFHVVFKGLGGLMNKNHIVFKAHLHQTPGRDCSDKLMKLSAVRCWYAHFNALKLFYSEIIHFFLGIALSNGYLWKKQRKFANAHLRYFGEGQKSLERYIEIETNFLCDAFKEEQGKFLTGNPLHDKLKLFFNF